METLTFSHLPAAIAQLRRAWNEHDLALLAACLEADYASLHPVHAERNFAGREAALNSWRLVFETIPDLQAELLNFSVNGQRVWTEWRWSGTHVAGNAFNAGGVMIFELSPSGAQIASAHVYTEIIETIGPDWDAVIEEILSRQPAF